MPAALQCPHCQSAVSVADEDAGHRVTCPTCSKDFLAPGTAASLKASEDDDWLSLDESPQPVNQPTAAPNPVAESQDSDTDVDEFDIPLAPLPKRSAGNASPQVTSSEDELLAQFAGEFDAEEFGSSTEPLPGHASTTNAGSSSNESSDDPFGNLELPEISIPAAPNAAKPVAAKSEPEYQQEYRVKCSICGTMTYVRATQAGHKIKCNDCHSTIKVPQPPKVAKKPVVTETPKAMPLQSNTTGEKRRDPYQKSAADLLAAAESAEVESPPENYDTPSLQAWLKSVFGIFMDVSVVVHWLILTMVISIPVYLTVISQHPTLILGMFPFSIIAATMILACSFAILESVANEEESVTEWPVFDPGSWFGQMFMTAAAAGVALIPINAVFGTMLGASFFLIVINMIAIYLVFPFVLLSMMDMGSPFAPFSPEVARSINKCQDAWGGMYFSSGLLFFGLFLAFAMVFGVGAPGGVFVAIALTVAVVFTYFAMIGRLAYAIGQAVNSPARESSRD